MKSSFTDWALLVVPGVIWGASFLFIAEGLAAVEPNGVTFTRIAIGFLTLSLFPSARKPVARTDWAGTAALGVLWFAFPLSMFPFAEQHVSSALTGMLNGATPLFVAAVASLLVRQLPGRGTIAGLAIGFAGAVVMALPALGGSNSAFGVGLILAALVSYGIALNVARPLQQRNGAIPVVWRARGFALILTATAAGRMGATKASVSAFVIPVVALILGIVIRHEHVTTTSLVGAAICLFGAFILRDPTVLRLLLPRRAVGVGARI